MEDLQQLIDKYRRDNVARRLRVKDIEIASLREQNKFLQDEILKLGGTL